MTERTSIKEGALYIRVSTHMQEELSPDAQKRLLLDYAKSNHITVSPTHIYLEGGISGRKADRRPKFQEMIAAAKSKEHPFDVILVWKFSRFARNQEESIVYKSLLRRQCKVEVISVSEPVIDGPFGSLIERIIEWMDEYYSIRLSGEVFRGMSEKAMRGGYQARPPLGYKIVERGKPPIIVPGEAETVRMIFDWFVNQKKSYFEIAQTLNRLGIKTSHGKNFERRSIEYILQNPSYYGMIRWNRTKNETNEIKDPSEWIIEKGMHPPIITEELYNAAQQRIAESVRPRGVRPTCTYKHWLSGLFKCPECGRTMIAKSVSPKEGKQYYYFTCYGYNKGKCFNSHAINSKKVEPYIIAALKEVIATNHITFRLVKPETPTDIRQSDILKEQLARISQKEQRIKEAYRSGIDTLEEYKENKDILKRERESLEAELNQIEEPAEESENSEQLMLERVQNTYELLQDENLSDENKGDLIRSIVEKIVYDKDTLKVYYYYNG